MAKTRKTKTLVLGPEQPEPVVTSRAPDGEVPDPVTVVRAHNHYCETCKQIVAYCAGECAHPGPAYCSVHVPVEHHTDSAHPYFGARVEDKPIAKMHVKVIE